MVGGCSGTRSVRPRAREPGMRKTWPVRYASDEITSPPALVEMARKVGRLTLSLMNWTCPSSISMFTPPG